MSAQPQPRHTPAQTREPSPLPPPASEPRSLSVARLLDGRGFNLLRFGTDALMLTLAALAAVAGADRAHVSTDANWALVIFPPLTLLLLYLRGMYRTRLRLVILDGIAPVVGAISVAAMAVIGFLVFTSADTRPGPLVARAWLFGVLYVGGARILLALTQRRARQRGLLTKPAVIVGAGVIGAQVARRLEEVPEYGLHPIGFLDGDPPADIDVVDRRAPVLGSTRELERIVAETGVRHVILAFTHSADRDMVPLVRRCNDLDLEILVVPRLFESVNERVTLEHLGGMPLMGLRTVDLKGWQFAIKHAMDLVIAGIALITLAPLLAAVAAGVKLSSPGPVLYRQRRVGRDGRTFDLFKFRSMRLPPGQPGAQRKPIYAAPEPDFQPEPGHAPGGVEGEDRRTRFGRWIRRTAVDELPQLINVLRREMSLVGPRPERPEFVELFRSDIDRYSDRHRVRSGLTGWAQVHGFRGQTSLADRVEWDNFYIENWSLWLDVKIVLMTVVAVFRHRDED